MNHTAKKEDRDKKEAEDLYFIAFGFVKRGGSKHGEVIFFVFHAVATKSAAVVFCRLKLQGVSTRRGGRAVLPWTRIVQDQSPRPYGTSRTCRLTGPFGICRAPARRCLPANAHVRTGESTAAVTERNGTWKTCEHAHGIHPPTW
jgi:hypothetical protein